MTDYHRDMSGALFKNDKKEKPSHPDYRGDITINGEKFRLVGWIKQGQEGEISEHRCPPRRAGARAGAAGA